VAIFQITGSLDEMLELMQKANEAADAKVVPWQAALQIGDYVVRVAEDIAIYQEILDPVQREVEALRKDPNNDEDDIREAAEYVRQSYARPGMENYRFSMGYSVACPEGELGDFHVSTALKKISKEAFEEARAAGWPQTLMLAPE
jgi:hypothetical protein